MTARRLVAEILVAHALVALAELELAVVRGAQVDDVSTDRSLGRHTIKLERILLPRLVGDLALLVRISAAHPEWDANNVTGSRCRDVFAFQPQIVPANRVAVPSP